MVAFSTSMISANALSELEYSANLGLTYGQTSLSDSAFYGVDVNSKVGFLIQVQAKYNVNNNIALNVGLGVNQINTEYVTSTAKTDLSITYLNIPVTATYSFNTESNWGFAVEGTDFGLTAVDSNAPYAELKNKYLTVLPLFL